MKNLHSFLLIVFLSFFVTSCSNDNDDTLFSVVGEWELTEWNANIMLDLNNDATASFNLLEEVACINNEILTFEANGVVTSNNTFNPKAEFFLQADQQHSGSIECSTEGSIGFASSYIEAGNTIEFNGSVSEFTGNQIIRTFQDEIKIYNEDLSQVIETRDLILVYTKR